MADQYVTKLEADQMRNLINRLWGSIPDDSPVISMDFVARLLATVDALEKALRDGLSYDDRRVAGSDDRARALLAALEGK